MNNQDLSRIKKFIQKADRPVLELLVYSIISRWSYERAITLCSAARVQRDIDELEEIQNRKVYNNVSNPHLKLVKKQNRTVFDERIEELKKDLRRYKRRYMNATNKEETNQQ